MCIRDRLITIEAHQLGPHNVLIDCTTDTFPEFQKIQVQNDFSGKLENLGDVAPSISHLRATYHKQACKIRVFVNPTALKLEYRDKLGRRKIGEAVEEAINEV